AADGRGGHVDDRAAPPAGDHGAGRRLRAEEPALQIHVEDEVPVALAHLEERHSRIDACVVDEHVDPAELANDLPDHRLRTRRLRDVRLDQHGPPADAPNFLDDLVSRTAIVEIVHADVGAFTRERHRDGAPDTLLGAGHQRHLPGEPHRRPPNCKRASAGGAPAPRRPAARTGELYRPLANVLGSRRELIPEGANGQRNRALVERRVADSRRTPRHRLHRGHQARAQRRRPLPAPPPPASLYSPWPATIPPFSMARWSFPTWVPSAATSVSTPGASPRWRTRSSRLRPLQSSTPGAGGRSPARSARP